MTIEAGRLISNYGDDPPEPVFFIALDVEVTAGSLAQGRVQRDNTGAVTGYLYLLPDGQKIEIRKNP